MSKYRKEMCKMTVLTAADRIFLQGEEMPVVEFAKEDYETE